jgi:hypothetical protein
METRFATFNSFQPACGPITYACDICTSAPLNGFLTYDASNSKVEVYTAGTPTPGIYSLNITGF